jgi:ribonuclease T2
MQRFNAWTFAAIAALMLAVLSAAVNAQERTPWPSERFNPPPQQNVAGDFDYYALVLSWSPTYCSTASNDDDQQCNRNDGKRYSFVLHGLWPQYEKGYPEMCHTARRPYIRQPLIDSMLDIMPSGGLVVHEYRAHGTCSGLPPESYFNLARQLYGKIRIPERFENPFETQYASPSEVMTDFVRANPAVRPDTMAIACGGAGNRLKEIYFCFAKDGRPRRCGDNENQRRMCSTDNMMVPPVRSTAREDQDGGRPKPSSSPYPNSEPRPRLIEGPNGN